MNAPGNSCEDHRENAVRYLHGDEEWLADQSSPEGGERREQHAVQDDPGEQRVCDVHAPEESPAHEHSEGPRAARDEEQHRGHETRVVRVRPERRNDVGGGVHRGDAARPSHGQPSKTVCMRLASCSSASGDVERGGTPALR